MSYRDLRCYQQATIVHDFTVLFCDRYIEGRTIKIDWINRTDQSNESDRSDGTNRTDKTDRTDRTNQTNQAHSSDLPYRFYSRQSDQMIQAARSGKQNIVEGAKEKNSKSMGMKLTSVGRASFEELLQDFEDYLRQHGLKQWDSNDPRALKVRNLYKFNGTDRNDRSDWTNGIDRSDKTDKTDLTDRTNQTNQVNKADWINWSNYLPYLDNPEDAANAAICLIHQVNFLTDRLMESQREDFVQKGGWSENLRREREEEKKKKVMEWMKRRMG